MSRSRETDYGKGDDDRTEDHKKYREGWEKLDWGSKTESVANEDEAFIYCVLCWPGHCDCEEEEKKPECTSFTVHCICPTNASGIRLKTLIECPKEHIV